MIRVVLILTFSLLILVQKSSSSPLRSHQHKRPQTLEQEQISPSKSSESLSSNSRRHHRHSNQMKVKVVESKFYTLVFLPKRRRRNAETQINKLIVENFNRATQNRINEARKSNQSENPRYDNCFLRQVMETSDVEIATRRCAHLKGN